ncbi:MAG: FAD/NAD(P)-binding oxidoreductase [Eubacteriales bacterium]|nr:FAD/NAD(P)-binding oxidoreductase [Eubacteriales bacterium]
MAKILIVGAGFAGHFGAMTLADQLKRKGLAKQHEITVINRGPNFNYIPSLIWVGIGQMAPQKMQFDLAKVYKKLGIKFHVGKVFEIHPDEQYALMETDSDKKIKLDYDYLMMATGPLLNFPATPGLGPDNGGFTNSVCTPPHAVHAAENYLKLVDKLEKGEAADVIIGTGHGTCTCQGAALEYLFNVHNDLKKRGLRDLVNLTWLSNEPALGDMGISGVEVQTGNGIMDSAEFVQGLFEGYKINWQIRSHVNKIEADTVHYETVEGDLNSKHFDFAMLLPPFKGQPISYIAADGSDITSTVCNPAGFVKVDAVYGKAYADLDGPDWPKTYQSSQYKNIYSAGIAFAPPGPLSKPSTSPNGTVIAPAPPRTGYTSELCGHAAALNIVDMIEGKSPSHSGSMAETPGLCVASMNKSAVTGNAMVIGLFPMARNRAKYPGYGRDLKASMIDIGLSGSWFKLFLHYAFMHKLQARPFWRMIP